MQQRTDTPSTAPSLADHIDQNIESVAGLYRREREAIGWKIEGSPFRP